MHGRHLNLCSSREQLKEDLDCFLVVGSICIISSRYAFAREVINNKPVFG